MKLFLIYGWLFVLSVAAFVFTLLRRPKLTARASYDPDGRAIRCVFRFVRSSRPVHVYHIWMPVDSVEAMGACPPKGFRYKETMEGQVIWEGNFEFGPNKDVVLSIPIANPKSGQSKFGISYEHLMSLGIGIFMKRIDVVLDAATLPSNKQSPG